ncbi:MAG: helix-turn-helix domain-containing protein [Oscillospiraceae bacterium]|jgi:transcriptional regulator with XRE-family HTH domain
MDLKNVLGQNIVKYRSQNRITQQTLAVRADVSISHLRNIEHGETNTTVDVIERISRELHVEASVLFEDKTI